MIRKVLLLAILLFSFSASLLAQVGQGELRGKVLDKETGDPLPFVNVVVEMNGVQVAGAASDFDGKYSIKPISPGKYTIKASFTGFKPIQTNGVVVNADKITFFNVELQSTDIELTEFEVVEYSVPLISKDNTSAGGTITAEEIMKMPNRGATSLAQTVGGVYSKDDGSGDLNIRGSRSDANYYFIDGMKVRGSNALPQGAIEQVTVITGGVPAQYGDITGGVISITTKGVSREYFGGVEFLSSGFKSGNKTYGLDKYGYNLAEASISGPLLMKRDTAGKKTDPLLGFFISSNFTHEVEPRPSILGFWQIKEDVLESIKMDPLRIGGADLVGTFQNAQYLRLEDFEKVDFRQNVSRSSLSLQGKIDVATTKNTNLTFGGTYNYNVRNEGNFNMGSGTLYSYQLMNQENLPRRVRSTWRAYARFTQRFGSADPAQEEKNASLIKNAYYSIQADYSEFTYNSYDESHRNNFFNYGYVGKFQRFQARDASFGVDSSLFGAAFYQTTFVDTLIGFTPDTTINPDMARFTQKYYELYGWKGYDANGVPVFDPIKADDPATTNRNDFLRNFVNIESNGGYLNGSAARDVYGIWTSHAAQNNGYVVQNQDQFRLTASGSADIKDHAISIGFEYEQRIDRLYSLAPRGLWTLGRLYTNNHITNLDSASARINTDGGMMIDGQLVPIAGGTFPFVSMERQNAAPGDFRGDDPQAFFDYNFRKALGLNPDGVDFIDFDNYGPDQLKIDYFSADELLANGNGVVSYYGYDHHGNRLRSNPTFDDFFNLQDEYGNYVRPVGAFQPIYIAGYIQDKFSFDDLVFNVGVRVDRYDANQQVLRDPYVLFPTIKAGETEALELTENNSHPSNIGDDYVVYVDNLTNPTAIVGYRSGENWFNAQGAEIDDPSVLRTASGIAPLLRDKENTAGSDISTESFEDYKPQTNFMPRIAFSFPINDDALFFAHYDILTKRPGGANRLDPTDYYFLEQRTSFTLNNPDLQPEKTIDYEVGFQQKLSKTSSLKINAFYREMRDQVQVINRVEAFPRTYRTFGNRDFGTVKGMTFTYDLRRTGNVWMKASYTLQFAEGTGSDTQTQLGLIRQGKQNLRVANPLNFDQRHTIIATVDYRYSRGADYNGPVVLGSQILANTGANIVFNAGSGTPYSALRNVIQEGLFTSNASVLDGSVNGSRLPWQFRIDARIDRDFEFKLGSGEKARTINGNIYLQILNALNAKNITQVYRATGSAEDDGFLTAAIYQNQIQVAVDEQSFRELYSMKIANPGNFNLPRRMRLGLMFNF